MALGPNLKRRLRTDPRAAIRWRVRRLRRNLRPVRAELILPWLIERSVKRIVQSSKPIVLGPWLSEVGFELLYWIPFLNWVDARFGLPKDRTMVVSRGGVRGWYGDLSDLYFDVLGWLPTDEFRRKGAQRIAQQGGGQKQSAISDFDQEIIEEAKKRLGRNEISLLHPSLMYKMFRPFWLGHQSMLQIETHTKYRKFSPPSLGTIADGLPSDYVAVKFYSSSYLPDTLQNQSHIKDLLSQLTASTHVVSLDTGLNLDDHQDYGSESRGRIFSIRHLLKPGNNLDIQTRVVSNARAFVGTYGGFSYLAPFLGVPSVSFYSEGQKLATHMYAAQRAFSQLNTAPYVVLDTRDLDALSVLGMRVPDAVSLASSAMNPE